MSKVGPGHKILDFCAQRSQQKKNFGASVGHVVIDCDFEALHGLKTTQNLSKNGPKTVPSPRDAASQNARFFLPKKALVA